MNSLDYYILEDLKKDASINFGRPYQRCNRTVMDTIADPNISFDENGVCNYWHAYQEFVAKLEQDPIKRQQKLEKYIHKIKQAGKGQKYDCLIGVSGGIDSTYVAVLTKEMGLRPLAVHFDGGWDNIYGQHNMEILEKNLGLDIHTLKVDFEEIRDLLVAYLKASVVDIGVYADHAIHATMYNLAREANIKHVLVGSNYKTEFIAPKAWIYNKFDLVNLRDIHKKFGKLDSLPTYPTYGFYKQVWFRLVHKLEIFNILDLVDFDTQKVETRLKEEIDWRPYPRKHGESLFTTFYQNYILPKKFGIDKRKIHLSSLICSGEITREEALKKLDQPLYTQEEFEHDFRIVLDKLELSEKEFQDLMSNPIKSHDDYKTDKNLRKNFMKFLKLTSGLRKAFKK